MKLPIEVLIVDVSLLESDFLHHFYKGEHKSGISSEGHS